LLAYGRWFSPDTPASSTTKTGCHDIAEILLKVALSTKNQQQQNQITYLLFHFILCFRLHTLKMGLFEHGNPGRKYI
jgi:hypothetical protein